MDEALIDGVFVTPLKRVTVPGGDVLHAMKASEPGYHGFGEAYFSLIGEGVHKGWKRHQRMTLNLVVPAGAVQFVMIDDRPQSPSAGKVQRVVISPENYCRLTVPPMVWMAFEGVASGQSMVLNVADIAHDPDEVDRRALTDFDINWSDR